MKTIKQHPTEPAKLAGGIHREFSPWEPGGGLWRCTGAHGNTQGALRKWSGLHLENSLPVAAKVDGLFQLRQGSAYRYLAMGGGNIYKTIPNTLTGLLTQIYSGLTPHIFDVGVLNNIAYLVSGVNPNLKIDQSGIVTGMGIVAPSVAPTVATGIAGVLSGDYQVVYTFKNSVTGFESDPSPASAVVTVLNQQINVSGIGVSSDAQVDRRRIYRTVAGSGGFTSGVFLFDSEIPNNVATTISTNLPDSQLGEAVLLDSGTPPQASFIAIFNGMVLLCGLLPPNESRVVVSGVLRGEAFNPDDVYDLDPEETDIITGIKQFGLFVAVGKRKGLFIGEGTQPDQMTFTRTRVNLGPLGQFGMINVESDLYYLSEKGPTIFSGLSETFLGRPIQDVYATFDLQAIQTASGIYYPALNMVIWNVTTAGQGSPDQAIIYNIVTKELTLRALNATVLSTYLDGLGRTQFWVGDSTGKQYTGDVGFSENGAPIPMEVVTRGIRFKGARREDVICFRHIHTAYQANGGSAPVTVSYAVDDPDAAYTVAGTFLPTTGSLVTHDIAAYGNLLFVRYTVSSTEPLLLYEPLAQGFVVGRRRT